MHFKKLLLLLCFIFLGFKAFPAVFVVTSNADSGPGTLREALTLAAANGTSVKDYINFNLPGTTEAEHTITMQTLLPDVTGNIIIDGTTQPGLAFGVSNAKVIITIMAPAQNLNAFNVSTQVGKDDAVEFYGLYIKGFSPSSFGGGSAIVTTSRCKLVIGTPGKGNVICGNNYAVLSNLQNAIIQSNFIGIEPDGKTAFPNWYILYAGAEFDNLLIGGKDQADGNVFIGTFQNGIYFGTGTGSNTTETVTIQNNYFGTDYTGTKTVYNINSSSYIYAYVPTINLNVTANVFSAGTTAITVLGVGASTVTVTGNFFGTDKTQAYSLGSGGQAIETNGFVTTTIGGAGALQNVFTGYFNPILAPAIQSSTDVIENKFYCNNVVELSPVRGNYIRLIKLFDNEVSGDAPPGAIVQLYYSTTQCTTCNPNTWFATVMADANGVWDYIGDTRQNIMVSSTVANNTIGFQPYVISQDEVAILNQDCHHKGSIEIAEKRHGRFQFIWKDNKGTIIGTNQKIENLDPGEYTLEINEGGNCPAATGRFDIINLTTRVYPQTFQLDCNNPTGHFGASFITVQNIAVAKYYWEDNNGNVISNDASIKTLPAGKYYLYVTDSNGCNSNTALYEVVPAVAQPLIDDGTVTVTNANCDFTDGSISGISISNLGNATYGWSKADGTIINYGQINLTKTQAGQYYFFVAYSINCSPVKSRLFTIGSNNRIAIIDSLISIIPSSCSSNNGSITGLKVTGATQYQWADAANKIVGTTADLQNMAAGDYMLTASNSFGCSKTSKTYHIGLQPPTQYSAYAATILNACFGTNNGSVAITTDALVASARWVNSQGNTIGNTSVITNIAAGAYQLYLTDKNGCESLYKSYTVTTIPQLQIVSGSEQISGDQCGLKTGSVNGIQVAGGLQPYTYLWLDANNNTISSSINLSGINAGSYTFQVNDASKCNVASAVYAVQNQNDLISPPEVRNVQLCNPGDALLEVSNPSTVYSYRLYNSETSVVPLDQQSKGIFKAAVTTDKDFYISQISGDCESARTVVHISVGLTALDIANTFTPNGDGINDYWKIIGIGSYPDAIVQVFTRYGGKLFESKGYIKPFDGISNGRQLPSGVYYYIINLSTKCSLLTGSLTIIR